MSDVSHNKESKRNNEKEREEKQKGRENEILSKAIIDADVKVRYHKNKSEKLEESLRMDAEGVCVECNIFQSKSMYVEASYEVLVEKLKDELCRLIFMQQEEEHFEVDDMKNKINEEHELYVK